MEELSCFLCKEKDPDCISLDYRLERNTVQEDLMEMYGDAIQHYLNSNDSVCMNCVQILSNMVRLKRQIYEVVVDNAVSVEIYGKPSSKSFNFANLWISRPNSSCVFPTLDNFVGRYSPNDLLVVTGSIPYDERCDPVGTGSRYGCDTPFLDREVQRVTSRSRYRRRGHKWTRRKSSSSNRSRSNMSRSTSRHSHSSRTSATSGTSHASASSRKKKIQQSIEVQLKRIVGDFFYESESLNRFTREYLKKFVNNDQDGGRNDNTCFEDLELPSVNRISVKTRFASDVRSKVLSEYQQLIFECPYNSCQEIMYTLEHITEHRVKMHNEMAMFWCEQCKFYYLTQEHLDIHKDVHFKKFIAYCIYCSEEYTNKRLYEEHLNEHLNHSFPCIYCDKFFLRKQLCENHVRMHHPGKKRKIKRIKPQSILDRIDKNTEKQEETKVNTHDTKNFEIKILWQHGKPEETPRVNEDDLEDMDLDLENLEDIGLVENLIEECSTKE